MDKKEYKKDYTKHVLSMAATKKIARWRALRTAVTHLGKALDELKKIEMKEESIKIVQLMRKLNSTRNKEMNTP